jgi:hypothetical protein
LNPPCEPWSEWNTAPASEPLVSRAAVSASAINSVRMCSAIAHPASRREKQSITVARYRFAPSVSGR